MPREKCTVAVDCDDTLIPTAQALIDAYRREYGVAVSADDFYSANPAVWGVEEYGEAVERVGTLLRNADFMHSIEPFDDAVGAIDRLASADIDLYIVTGRSHEIEHVTNEMIDTHFPGMFKGVEHTNHFQVGKRRTKGKVCRELGAHLLVDDHSEHIDSVLDEGGLDGAIVYGEYGWNSRYAVGGLAVRCANWTEVEAEVMRHVDQ